MGRLLNDLAANMVMMGILIGIESEKSKSKPQMLVLWALIIACVLMSILTLTISLVLSLYYHLIFLPLAKLSNVKVEISSNQLIKIC